MLRNWNVLKLSSLMAVALAASPVPAAGPTELGQDELKTIKESVDALTKKLDKMNSDVLSALGGQNADILKIKADLKTLNDASDETKLKVDTTQGAIKALETQVANLKAELDKLQNRGTLMYPAEKAGMSEITSRLAKIDEALAQMAQGRTSYASPPVNPGRIQLVNMYPEDMLFVVNGKNYRLAPFTTATLESQPAGAFTYEVISGTYGVRGSNRPLLEAGKTYTITVR